MCPANPSPLRRRRLSLAEGGQLAEAWRQSVGVSKSSFCSQRGISPVTLGRWLARCPSTAAASTRLPAFIEVGTTATAALEVVAGDAVVRVRPDFDAGLLRAVVAALVRPW